MHRKTATRLRFMQCAVSSSAFGGNYLSPSTCCLRLLRHINCSEVSSISDMQHAMCTALLFWQLAFDFIFGSDVLMAFKMSLASRLSG